MFSYLVIIKSITHTDIREQKGIQSYELVCAHKKRSEISGETRCFGLVARPERRVFHRCQGHSGIGRACNMKCKENTFFGCSARLLFDRTELEF
jgi:hypothetical protein